MGAAQSDKDQLTIDKKRSMEVNVQADENEIDQACQQPDELI